jgi:hypothetical protein
VQFTCWGADGANEGGNGIERILLNIGDALTVTVRRQFALLTAFSPSSQRTTLLGKMLLGRTGERDVAPRKVVVRKRSPTTIGKRIAEQMRIAGSEGNLIMNPPIPMPLLIRLSECPSPRTANESDL